MREPDGWDSVRVLAIAALLCVGVGGVGEGAGIPRLWRGVATHLVLLAVPLAYARAAGLRSLRASGVVRLGLRQLALVLMASLGSMWLLKGISDLGPRLLTELGLRPEEEVRELTRAVGKASERGGVLAMALMVLAPALCEETFFRGIFFRGLIRSLGPAWALAIATVLFSYWHGFWVQRVMMVFVGLYLGLVVWLTGSLWAGVIAHAVNNFAVLAVTRYYGDRMEMLQPSVWMLALSGGVFGLAIALLALERGRPSPAELQGSGPEGRPDT